MSFRQPRFDAVRIVACLISLLPFLAGGQACPARANDGRAPEPWNAASPPGPRAAHEVQPEGIVVGWGFNDEGQIGDATKVDRNTMVKASGLGKVIALSAGSRFSVALKADGTVWTWGYDYTGKLGDGRSDPRPQPQIVGGLSDVVSIAAGSSHVLALKRDGTVWAWGFGQSGQLGHGFTGDPAFNKLEDTLYGFGRPVQVFGLHNIVAVSAGAFHSLALDGFGAVWAWGSNSHGELSETPGERVAFPSRIRGLGTVTAISAGYWHNLALTADGSVWGWGCNYSGQLGASPDPMSVARAPVPIPRLEHIISIAAGRAHNLAIDQDGLVWTWGLNEFGMLANGTAPEAVNPRPEPVMGLNGIVSVAAGYSHSVALASDGTVWSWGSNEYDSLGNGADVPPGRMRRVLAGLSGDYGPDSMAEIPRSATPGPVVGASRIRAISASSSGWHTLALVVSP